MVEGARKAKTKGGGLCKYGPMQVGQPLPAFNPQKNRKKKKRDPANVNNQALYVR